jgi:hypothetical protein
MPNVRATPNGSGVACASDDALELRFEAELTQQAGLADARGAVDHDLGARAFHHAL